MDYCQYNPQNFKYPFNLSQSNQNQNNLDNIEKVNNSIDDNYKKYIMNKNSKMQYTLDIDSSREEIHSKEEIIQTKDEEEIEHLGTGKFRLLNTITEQEDNKNEKELNDEKQDYIVNNITEKKINNSDNKNDNSNKITNNICIIINKPEMNNKDMDRENKKNIIFEYLNTFGSGEEEDNSNNNINKLRYTKSQKVNKRNKRPLFEKINKNKKNSYKENLKYKNDHLLKNNNSFGHNYFYSEREDNNSENKLTLHKMLSQKQKKLKDLQKNIDSKTIALKDIKSQIDKLENKHTRSITFGEEKQFLRNNNGLKLNDLIKTDDSDYNINQKNTKRNKNNYYKFNKNNYTVNKSLNSEDRYFKDIPMTNIQTNKYNYLYRTMSPEIDKNNISFNKSIEEKRKMLGIPLKKNDYEKMNKKIEDDLNEDEENLKQKLLVYRKKKDEITKIYENRNKLYQENKENAKYLSKNVHNSYNGKSSKPKNPIRILYKDNSKPIYSRNNYDHNITNNFFNEIKSNSNLNIELRNKNIHYNNSYIVKRKDMEKTKKHYSNSQNDIFSFKKAKKNKTNNEKDKNMVKKKNKQFKEFQNKDIFKRNKEQNDLRCSSRLSDTNNNNQKEKKIYENKSYYSKLLSKILNIKNKEFYSNNKKESIKAYTNNTINNINTNQNYLNLNNKYMNLNNLLNKNNELNLNNNNPKNESQSYKIKEVFSPQKNDEIMTVENNERGKTIHIIKKRNRSPQINQSIQRASPEIKKQNIKIESKKQDNEKDQTKVEKKEYKNNLKGPGRGISALRRINQKIENYKKRINTRKRRPTKPKNPQFKSSSQLKQKFGKHVFLKVKQNKSINNLPNVNRYFQNFDFIDNL